MMDLFIEPFKSFYNEITSNLKTGNVYVISFFLHLHCFALSDIELHSLSQFCEIFLQTFAITFTFDYCE